MTSSSSRRTKIDSTVVEEPNYKIRAAFKRSYGSKSEEYGIPSYFCHRETESALTVLKKSLTPMESTINAPQSS